jgi:hypothetical protein
LGGYKGLYHVLGGAINPLDHVGPDDLKIAELVARVEMDGIEEIILATNPTIEGEGTALYIKKKLEGISYQGKLTRIGSGLPMGAELGFADQALISQIDFEGMREKKGKEAQERYERAERLLGSIPKLHYVWKDLIDEGGSYSHMSIEEKRSLYHGQPAIRILNFAKESLSNGVKEDQDFLTWLDLEDYQVTKEEYIKKAQDGAISTFAVIKDGKWYERGQMGWWACVSNEKEDSAWECEFEELIKGLSPDTLLTIVDCHI